MHRWKGKDEEKNVGICVKSIKNLKNLKYHVFVIKHYFLLVFVISVKGNV